MIKTNTLSDLIQNKQALVFVEKALEFMNKQETCFSSEFLLKDVIMVASIAGVRHDENFKNSYRDLEDSYFQLGISQLMIDKGLIEPISESPCSKYRLTEKGREYAS